MIGSTIQSPEEDRRFAALMRDANRCYRPDFARPEGEIVKAYLMRTASDYQRDVVRQALLASPEFRREILDMEKALADLEQTCQPSFVCRLMRKLGRIGTRKYMTVIATSVFIGLVGLATIKIITDGKTEYTYESGDKPDVVAAAADTGRDSVIPTIPGTTTTDDTQEFPMHTHGEGVSPDSSGFPGISPQEYVWLEPEPWRSPQSVFSDCDEITIVGEAPIMGDRRQARMLAGRRAYYAALAHESTGEPITGHYAALQAVTSGALRFITDWDAVAVNSGENDLVRATYAATVCTGMASDESALSAIHLFNQTVLANPRVALFLRSDAEVDSHRRNIADALSGAFLGAGYRIHIPSADFQRSHDIAALFDAAKGQAVHIGRSADADIVLGVDMSVQAPRPSESELLDGYRAVDVTVGFRVMLTGSGRLAHSGLFTATGLGPSDERARTNGVTKAARQLVRTLIEMLPQAIRMYPRLFTIDCMGCTERQFLQIEEFLSDAEDVFAVKRRAWNDTEQSGSLSVMADPLTGSIDIIWMEIRQRLGTPVKLLHRDDERLALSTFM